MSDDVKQVVDSISSKIEPRPFVVKRYDNVQFGYNPKMIDNVFSQEGLFTAKIVDDSNYIPNAEFIRNSIASGSTGSSGAHKGVYDFADGVDNGFTPKLRGLGFDQAEIDAAAKATIEEASARQAKDKAAKDKAAKDARNNQILDNLASLSDSSSQADSSSPAE